MGDRFRLPELLAAIGTIGLAIAVFALPWFDGTGSSVTGDAHNGDTVGAPAYATATYHLGGTGGAGHAGWFAYGVLLLTLVAAAIYLARMATSRGPERFMLQGPIVYAVAGFAVLVLLVRLFVFKPGLSTEDIGDLIPGNAPLVGEISGVSYGLEYGAYLGLLFVWLINVGSWFSMRDERTGTKAAKARTEAILVDVPTRPAPPLSTGAAPSSEASVIADDAVGTDPTVPAVPGPGAVHADPPPPSDPTSGSPA